jgi:F-type H+-transporting ATPase subunit alpha
VLDQNEKLSSGIAVHRSGRRLDIGVGDSLWGRIIDPLGRSLDGKPEPLVTERRLLESPSPTIIERDFVNQPLYTGNRIIDSLLPIGRGQRQLIIGDNGLGKSSLALDTILRQSEENVYCVYVAIGQTRSTVASIIKILEEHHALEYTTLVVAEANELSGFRYLAPFAGCAIAEYAMRKGKDTLIIYDDLSQHANSYRELSLLLHRPPGREAYPGDIFYLHAQLLERSTVLSPEYGGGSMTALPIIETKQGEISSYIPTNLISITDGQIYLDQKLFSSGILPAIDITRSVSRIGGKAQHPAIKRETGHIRLDFLQFLELEAFTRFGTKLEASMEIKLKRGELLRKILTQERFRPVSAKAQLAWLISYNEKILDDITEQKHISKILQKIERAVEECHLTLSDDRQAWKSFIEDLVRDD